MQIKQGSVGSVAIEATLSLSFFIFAFMVLLSFANLARTESIIQHAINQTAKEISQCAYLAEKSQILPIDQTAENSATENGVKNLTDLLGIIGQSSRSEMSAQSSSEQVFHDVLSLAKREAGTEIVLASFCQWLSQKYLCGPENRRTANEFLADLSIENGFEGIDFSTSSFLADGRTVNVVAIYRVRNMLPGFFQKTIVIRQVASTAAWVKAKTVEDDSTSKWQLPDIQRGRAWLEAIRQENASIAVVPGLGIDLYENGRCTSVWSMNVFANTYRSNGQQNTQAIEKQLSVYANQALANVAKLPNVIPMNDGRNLEASAGAQTVVLQIIVPEEALSEANQLSAIAEKLRAEKGVIVVWTYREKLNLEVEK